MRMFGITLFCALVLTGLARNLRCVPVLLRFYGQVRLFADCLAGVILNRCNSLAWTSGSHNVLFGHGKRETPRSIVALDGNGCMTQFRDRGAGTHPPEKKFRAADVEDSRGFCTFVALTSAQFHIEPRVESYFPIAVGKYGQYTAPQ